MKEIELLNKVVLITGASRGIGKAIAKELAERGAIVIGSSTSSAGADFITKYLSPYGGWGVVLDVTNIDSCKNLINSIKKESSGPHILVNNAGINCDSLMVRMKDQDWSSVINTNLSAIFHICRAVMPNMIKNHWGRIVNITSVVGFIGNIGQANYAASKAGITGMSSVLAKELGSRNITINCVAPGFIDTDMTRSLNKDQIDSLIEKIPLRRLGNVNDIAKAVAFLVGPDSSYITGTTLHVNGGMYF